jgi:hypothetical protein
MEPSELSSTSGHTVDQWKEMVVGGLFHCFVSPSEVWPSELSDVVGVPIPGHTVDQWEQCQAAISLSSNGHGWFRFSLLMGSWVPSLWAEPPPRISQHPCV